MALVAVCAARSGDVTEVTDAAQRAIGPLQAAGAARELAGKIAAKSPTVIRAAKESLNGIDLWDVKKSYRFEQGFTFELNLSGVADEHRDAFAGTDKGSK